MDRRKNSEMATVLKIPMFSVSKKPRYVLRMNAGLTAMRKDARRPVLLPPRSLPRKYMNMHVRQAMRTGKKMHTS
jgi:hypothetical protein